MATYNGAAFLREQLLSLQQQTTKPAELVVCDDQSSDATVDILRAFATDAPFPVHIHVNPERLGWRGNFIKASSLCKFNLIAFCDQDDLWYPQKLQIMSEQFEDPSVLLAYHNADLIDHKGCIYGTLQPIADKKRVIERLSRPTIWSNPFGLTIVFRASLTAFNDMWPRTVDLSKPEFPAAHDQWFYFLATNVGKIISVPDRLLAYRQHASNTVGWKEIPRSKTITPDDQLVIRHATLALGMLEPFTTILESAASREIGDARDRLVEASQKNRALIRRLQLRREIYTARTFLPRLQSFLKLCTSGGYALDSAWGLGRRALLADATVGLFRKRK
jgi:glycosyltransferase involved in cell wall biosynthesis